MAKSAHCIRWKSPNGRRSRARCLRVWASSWASAPFAILSNSSPQQNDLGQRFHTGDTATAKVLLPTLLPGALSHFLSVGTPYRPFGSLSLAALFLRLP